MRVTNMMTSNQLLLNLNKSMTTLSFLQYQAETGNKIRYASDNPIIAGRSLKFRTNIVETEQYLSNVDQGRSWLNTTANAVKNVMEALSNSGENSIRSTLVSASNSGLRTISDAKIYANQLKETLSEILGEINATYAGRYIFSGFKTDECPVFDVAQPNLTMNITQTFNVKDIDPAYSVYIKTDKLVDVDEHNVVQSVPAGIALDDTAMPQEISCTRLKLPYDVGISNVTLPDFTGFTISTKNSQTDADAYLPGMNEINFIEDTGELIFGKSASGAFENQAASLLESYKNVTDATDKSKAISETNALLNALKAANTSGALDGVITQLNYALVNLNYVSTPVNPPSPELDNAINDMEGVYNALKAMGYPQDFSVNYTKTGFNAGEINPKAYFTCEDAVTGKKYNMDNQAIMYEFSINNKMQVNTLAKDLLTPELINDISDVIKLVNDIKLSDTDDLIEKLMLNDPALTKAEAEELAKEQLANEEKFYLDMIGQKNTDLIGKIDGHIMEVSLQNTIIGSRLSRLELISNRLQDDRINYEDLKSQNDSVDAAEVYVRYSSMLAVYQSALQTGASVIQMSLVNFI